MMEPDFNDDDLIDDYIEDSFEPPPGYEDDFLEEMMMDHGSGPAATASTKAITSKSTSGVEAATNGADLMEEEELDEEDVNINVAQVETSPTDIREVYDKRRDVHKSIYAFERYVLVRLDSMTRFFDWYMPTLTRPFKTATQYSFRYNPQNTNWGTTSGNNGSPNNTMRAKEWKTSKTATADNSSKIWEGMDTDRPSLTRTLVANRPKATAPDAQLLHFLATKHSRPKKIELPKHRMLHNPVAGNASLPMTLGDGTRVHVRVRKPSESTKKASVGASNMHALGTPIAELMFRVQAIRRKQAHERQEQVQCELLQGNDKNDTSRGATEIEDKLWVDKHAPSSFAHLLSDERTNREVVRALRAWDPYVFHREPPKRPDFGYRLPQQDNNNKQAEHAATKETDTKGAPAPKASKDRRPDEMSRVILLSGPPGVGKTTLAHIIALHAGYRPLEVNGSDERSASILTERLVRAMESTTLNVALMQGGGEGSKPKPNCLILDEIDGADAKDAVQSLVNIIRAEIPAKGSKGKNKTTYLRRPIIFICNNKYAPALRALLPFAKQFNVFPPSPHRLVARLRSVLGAEKMSVFGGSSLLNQLVASTCGDIRSCLYTLQFASSRARELASLERHSRDRGEALRDSSVVDISQSLGSALNGDGMKDQRNDVAGTITTIFRKKKEKAFGELFGAGKDTRSSTVRVLDSVEVRWYLWNKRFSLSPLPSHMNPVSSSTELW
jgi:chromosome transmission fidelity protein 18